MRGNHALSCTIAALDNGEVVTRLRHAINALPGAGAERWTDSGARLLTIAAQRFDLITEQARALLVTAGECHRQGELQFFKLMIPLDWPARLEMATRSGSGGPECSGL